MQTEANVQPAPAAIDPMQTAPSPATVGKPIKARRFSKRMAIKFLAAIAVIVLLSGGSAYGAYRWQHQKVVSLQSQVASLQSQLQALTAPKHKAKAHKKAAATNPTPAATPAPAP